MPSDDMKNKIEVIVTYMLLCPVKT
uniref:Uncharacterized protein n=1 Tax=Solanum lycopersicum TaxID=4081 RepID=K4AW54_SOLLC